MRDNEKRETMPTSSSRLAYDDIWPVLDRALNNNKTWTRVPCANIGEANQLRARINTARRIDRADNHRDFEKGHPLHNASVYDALCVRISEANEDGEVYVYLIKRDASMYEIEESEEEINGIEQGDRRDMQEVNQ